MQSQQKDAWKKAKVSKRGINFCEKKRKKQKEKRQKVAKLGVCENMREKQQEVVGIVADE